MSIPKSRRLEFSEIPIIDLSQQVEPDNDTVKSICGVRLSRSPEFRKPGNSKRRR